MFKLIEIRDELLENIYKGIDKYIQTNIDILTEKNPDNTAQGTNNGISMLPPSFGFCIYEETFASTDGQGAANFKSLRKAHYKWNPLDLSLKKEFDEVYELITDVRSKKAYVTDLLTGLLFGCVTIQEVRNNLPDFLVSCCSRLKNVERTEEFSVSDNNRELWDMLNTDIQYYLSFNDVLGAVVQS